MNERRLSKRIGLKAARFPRAVVLALDRLGVDLRDFRWKLSTGRYAKDYEMMLLLGARSISGATRMVSQYMSDEKQPLSLLSMQDLKKRRYIDNAAIRKARKIKKLRNKPLIGD